MKKLLYILLCIFAYIAHILIFFDYSGVCFTATKNKKMSLQIAIRPVVDVEFEHVSHNVYKRL